MRVLEDSYFRFGSLQRFSGRDNALSYVITIQDGYYFFNLLRIMLRTTWGRNYVLIAGFHTWWNHHPLYDFLKSCNRPDGFDVDVARARSWERGHSGLNLPGDKARERAFLPFEISHSTMDDEI